VNNLYFTGLPGTGKSTLARFIAPRLGLAHVDTDAEIERRVACSVADYWNANGERAFRAVERQVVLDVLADPAPKIVAFGGGALLSSDLRHQVVRSGLVVHLKTPPDLLNSRLEAQARGHALGGKSVRPILAAAEGLRARLAELELARAEFYAESHMTLWTDDEIETLADAVCVKYTQRPLLVPLGPRSYPVHVVSNEPHLPADVLASMGPSSIVLLTDTNVTLARRTSIESLLTTLAIPRTVVTLPAGESHKTTASMQTIWDAALSGEMDRDTVVVGFGGGVVNDMAGFAAATLLRGIRFVSIPTTLLSMVDASVGGKTGVDCTQGKNLIGAFHQPSHVIADVAHLETLPSRELCSGLAELVKTAALFDAALFHCVRKQGAALSRGEGDFAELVRVCLQHKIDVVTRDERETGDRVLLNFGHTVGHALERALNYEGLSHGEAVGLGMLAETKFGESRGWVEAGTAEMIRETLKVCGLPTEFDHALLAKAAPGMRTDKKRSGDCIRLPLVMSVGRSEVRRVTMEDLVSALLSP
jgi:shikimate kinase / 3-dehydroquinate synthase